MEEAVFYIGQGDPADKHSLESFAITSSLHTLRQFSTFKTADCPRNGAALTGLGPGERAFVASPNKALIQVFLWGKESPDQRIPVPEPLTCLSLLNHPQTRSVRPPVFRVPWLLAGGSKSGKLYVWEVASGNLLCVKDAHYQDITVVKFSECGSYIVTGSVDARIAVWSTQELISLYDHEQQIQAVKPYYSVTNHSLAITDVVISSSGIHSDLKLYTALRDCTSTVHNISTKTLLTTFVLPVPITSIARDPADRNIYVGLANGRIRIIPMYQITSNLVLESVGGCERIITLDPNDPELLHTICSHKQPAIDSETNEITSLSVSFDGTVLVLGDSKGFVYASDIVTRQVVQSFKECSGAVLQVQVNVCPQETLEVSLVADKTHRLIPNLKRVLADQDSAKHTLYMQIPEESQPSKEDGFRKWLLNKKREEFELKETVPAVNSTVKIVDNGSKVAELEEKLARVSQAYTELREKHTQLYEEHKKLVSEE